MNNNIENWSWVYPTEEGLYLACRGDVETEQNIHMVHAKQDGKGRLIDMNTMDVVDCVISNWHKDFKFARLCVGADK